MTFRARDSPPRNDWTNESFKNTRGKTTGGLCCHGNVCLSVNPRSTTGPVTEHIARTEELGALLVIIIRTETTTAVVTVGVLHTELAQMLENFGVRRKQLPALETR